MGQQPTKRWPPRDTSQGHEGVHVTVPQAVHDRGLDKAQDQVRRTHYDIRTHCFSVIEQRDQKDRDLDETTCEATPHVRQQLNMATCAIVAVELGNNTRHFSRICLSATNKPG